MVVAVNNAVRMERVAKRIVKFSVGFAKIVRVGLLSGCR